MMIFLGDSQGHWVAAVGHVYFLFVEDKGQATAPNVPNFFAFEVGEFCVDILIKISLKLLVGPL